MAQVKSKTKVVKVAATVSGGQVEFGASAFTQEENTIIARWIKDKEKMNVFIDGIDCSAMIVKATADEVGEIIGFKKFDIAPANFAKLVTIVRKNEPVEVIYEPAQKDLPIKGSAPGQEDLDFEKAEPKKMQSPDNPNQRRTPAQMQAEDLKRMKKEQQAKKTAKKCGKH